VLPLFLLFASPKRSGVTAGNILNFNVGAEVDLAVPKSFWSRLSGKYGNKFFWQEKVSRSLLILAPLSFEFFASVLVGSCELVIGR
jgi:hypothetical protein